VLPRSRSGDLVKCGELLSSVISGIVAEEPAAFISFAPQMTDVYPALNTISAGFNAQVPPINMSFASIGLVQAQMYNTWAQVRVRCGSGREGAVPYCVAREGEREATTQHSVNSHASQLFLAQTPQAETIAFATQYAQAVLAGFSATASSGQTFSLQLTAPMLALGYPASPSGAGSGFVSPSLVCAMICSFRSNGSALSLMTWDIGWDQQAGFEFSGAVASAAC
jgi:hypothetical protein